MAKLRTFEELDYQKTGLGELSLRRRAEPRLNGKILYEVKLGEEFLMSSLFVEAEVELARLGLATLGNQSVDVVVGGLGLGYTAAAVLDFPSVRSLHVIDVLQPVIDWHQHGLVPLGERISSDRRCNLVHADFFSMATSSQCGFLPDQPTRLVHAVLLDIDHSPSHWLKTSNRGFYSKSGLEMLASKLHLGGAFGLWSNDPPDPHFKCLLESVFHTATAHIVRFPNPLTEGESSNTVYIAQKAGNISAPEVGETGGV